MRIGQGFDVHHLKEGRPLILGGVSIPNKKGLAGHSDADVLVHAIMDAMLGAGGFGDIGQHFPDTDEKYKNVSSINLLSEINELLEKNNYNLINIDSTVIAQWPKIMKYIPEMITTISSALTLNKNCISVKATTTDKMGYLGRGEGIAAQAVVLIEEK